MRYITLLSRDSEGFPVFVESYNAKTKEIKMTRNLKKAKFWQTKQGAESSCRSIFRLYLDKKIDLAFEVRELK